MRFNSEHFVYFYAFVLLVFFRLPALGQQFFLILASYYFYMAWRPEYIVVIVALTLIDFWAGRSIAAADDPSLRRLALGVSLAANLSMLFAFKYYGFFAKVAADLIGTPPAGGLPSFFKILPIGLSFHTFQSIAYILDVYHRRVKPEKNLGRFALFIAFFPQMVAGPIERASKMLPQLEGRKTFDYRAAVSGFILIAYGLAKKLVIADNLAPTVNDVYSNSHSFGSVSFILASYLFAIQIYCDFSGYTDIARGCARVLGFELSENFRAPYLARSVVDFWRRWHISLSTWFRDYVYLPMGGSKRSVLLTCINLLVVFLISGFWHGANWTFMVWGLLHGVYVVVYRLTKRLREAVWTGFRLGAENPVRVALSVLITVHLVTIAWVFFRAGSLSDGLFIAKGFFIPIRGERSATYVFSLPEARAALVAFAAVLGIEVAEWDVGRLGSRSTWVRWPTYAALSLIILLFGHYGEEVFIYFQF